MMLEISNYNNQYKIKGQLTRLNLAIFNDAFRNIFDSLNDVVLDIEGVEKIDREGVNAIAKLHNESLTKGKRFSIIGLGCKELVDHFRSAQVA